MEMEIVHSAYLSHSENKGFQKTDDTILLEQLRSGSKTAFEKLYHRFWDRLYLAAYNILRNREASQDIIQEIFTQIWIRRESLAVNNVEAYLFTAVRFQVFRCIHDRKCKNDFVTELSKLPAHIFDAQLNHKEIEDAMKNGIAKLPEKCGKIFSLSRQEHLSNKEIALRLNISIKTVENQMSIAIKKMRKHLSPWVLRLFLLSLLNIFR